MKDANLSELTSLFFTTRQIIKAQLPKSGNSDPNTWLRFETLRFIAEAGNPTMQDVAQYLRVKAPSATSLIGHLAKAGLIERKGERNDKRIVRISLTARGRREVKNYTVRCQSAMRKAFSKLDEGELEGLATILRHLRDTHQK